MSTATDLADELDKELGANAVSIGVRGYLDTGIPELNWAISGDLEKGAPMGRMIEIFGGAASGKTFLATMMMAAAQKMGGIAGYSDHERSFSPELAQTLGLELDKTKFRYIKPETFEKSVEFAVRFAEIVRDKGLDIEVPLIWVFDSVASMIPHGKLFDEKGNRRAPDSYNMRDKLLLASATSQSYPLLSQKAEDLNMTVCMLNQVRMKPGVMYGDPTTTPGGQAAEFFASVRLNIGKAEITNGKKGDEKEVLGFEITSKVIKNKVARPFRKARWQVRFNEDAGVKVDLIATNLDFAIRSGCIDRDGKYCVWEGKKLYQSQLENQLKLDPDGNTKLLAILENAKVRADEDQDEETA